MRVFIMMEDTDMGKIAKAAKAVHLISFNYKVICEYCLKESEYKHYKYYFYYVISFGNLYAYVCITLFFNIPTNTKMYNIFKHIQD